MGCDELIDRLLTATDADVRPCAVCAAPLADGVGDAYHMLYGPGVADGAVGTGALERGLREAITTAARGVGAWTDLDVFALAWWLAVDTLPEEAVAAVRHRLEEEGPRR